MVIQAQLPEAADMVFYAQMPEAADMLTIHAQLTA